jgi:imidazolonepropionase-like amidohydrolase
MDVPICIGTDSLASNDQLDICSELNVLLENFTLALEDVLQWATWNGANALSMQDHIGCIEEQYTPGLLLLKEKGKQIEFIKRII